MYLRHFNENDYLELTKYYMPNLKEEQFKQIIREWNLLKHKNKFFEIFAIVENRQIVGMISLYQHTSTVVSEGVEIFKPFRNKGLATKSILLIQNIAKFYGYKVITAQVARKNIASIKLHKKLEVEIYHEFISLKENRQLLFIKTL